MTARTIISYQIDALDRITGVNDTWSEFARANDGAKVLPEHVLGKSLWDFISDPTIQDIYRRLTLIARQGRSSQFRYRCDSPTLRRVFQMQVNPRPNAEVDFTSTLLSEEERPAVPLLKARSEHSNVHVRVCSWCHVVAWPGENWLPLERAAERVVGHETADLPALTHGICEGCAAGMIAMMDFSSESIRQATDR